MNKLTLSEGSAMTCLFITCLFLAQSCKKDQQTDTDLPEATLSQLKNWYHAEKLMATGKTETLPGLMPAWDKVSIAEDHGKLIYEVEVNNPNHIFTSDKKIDKSKFLEYQKRNLFRLVLIQDKKSSVINGAYMNIIAESNNQNVQKVHYKKALNFNGTIAFYNIDGSFNICWHYTKGNLDNKLVSALKIGLGRTKTESTCGSRPIYADFCFELENNQQSCTTKIIGYDDLVCQPLNEFKKECTNGENNGGSDGGDGGFEMENPATAESPNKDIIDSLQGYRCAQALLTKMKTSINTSIAKHICTQ